MKLKISLLLGATTLVFVSCAKPIAQQGSAYPPADATNPYGVPQTSAGAYPSAATEPAAYPTAPAPTPSYSAPAASGSTYVIKKGDTLYSISRNTGKSVSAIQSANGLSGSTIYAGQTLTIPQ